MKQSNIQMILVAFVAIFTTIGSVGMGCANKDTSASAPAPTTGQTATGQSGTVKPTAEQEAAKKHGEEIGAAVQAANEAGQKGN